MAESQGVSGSFFVGDDLGVTKRWVGIAVAFFLGVSAFYVSGAYEPVYALIPGWWFVFGAGTILVSLSAWQASQNRGILVSLLLSIAPVTALFVQIVADGQGVGPPTLPGTVLRSVMWGVLFGAPIGGVGYLLGRLVRTEVA